MKRKNKFLIVLIIIFLIIGIVWFILKNNANNNYKSTTSMNANIKLSYNSNNAQNIIIDERQMILSKEKTTEAMKNNSVVLQEAIDQVSNSGGGTVQLPAGTYYFAPTKEYIEHLETGTSQKKSYYVIECKNNVKLIGAGINENDANSCTILKPYGMNLDVSLTMFQYVSQEQPKVYLENADFADFIINSDENSKISSSEYVAQGKGFAFSAFEDCDWNNVVVKNTDGTGFGMDLPINSTVTNCIAIGCGKAATEENVGASGFGIGTGYSEEESMKISNCVSIGNRKFGFFFEHQGRFVSVVKSRTAKGFLVTDCVARGNMYNFGGEKANDVIYERCISENSNSSDPNPLGNKNTQAFYFGTNTRRIYLEDCSVEQRYTNITDTSQTYYEPVYWAANNSIIDIGESKTEFNATENALKAEAIVMLWRYASRPGEVLIGGEQVDTGYNDVPSNAWYADAVAWAHKEGILDGGTLNGGESCPKAHFITMLWRYAGSPIVTTGNNYTDVSDGDFFANAVNWAISEKILIQEGTEFKPAEPYTKGEILTLLYRYNLKSKKNIVVYDYWHNGGNNSEKVYDVKERNENIDLNIEAQKADYEFVGWNTDKNATNKISSLTMQTDGIDLYAIYKRDIQLAYDTQGGNEILLTGIATIYNNQENTEMRVESRIPTKEGYVFKGWTDEKGKTDVKYLPGQTYKFSDNTILYAIWEEEKVDQQYVVTYNYEENGGISSTKTSELLIDGSSIDLKPTATKPGYEFVGWNTNKDATEGLSSLTIEANNVTLYAIYKKEVTLTFIDYKGTEKITRTESETAYNKNTSVTIVTPTINSYAGWTARYWTTKTEADAGQTVQSGGTISNVTGNATYYARYYQNITIFFSLNGGTGTAPNVITGARETNSYEISTITNQEITMPSTTATRTGYTFEGWNSNEQGTGTNYTVGEKYTNFTATITVYAKWKANTYTIEFNSNGGSGTIEDMNMTYDIPHNLKANVFYRDGYRFLGWNTDKNATIVEYEDKEKVNNLTTEDGGIITLYAIWEEEKADKQYVVSYNYVQNGGTDTTGKDTILNYGEEIDLTPTATKQGYEFVGWNTNKDATTGLDSLTMETNDVILYAIYKKEITLTFVDYDGNDENIQEKEIIIYNNDKGETTSPVINKYSDWTPRYWSISKEPNSKQDIGEEEVITNITGSQTYYARYTKEISIMFDKNEGEGTLPETIKGNIEVNSSNISNIQEFEVTIPNAEILREGYSFVGWISKKDGSEIDYEIGELSLFNTDITLFAKWVKDEGPTVDTTLPILEIQNNLKDKWTNQDIELYITAKDEESGIDKVTINGEVILQEDGDISYLVEQNGTYNIEAVDKAGNSIKKTIIISNIDKIVPTNVYEIEKSINDNKEFYEVTIKSNDENSGTNRVEYSYDNEVWKDCSDESVQKDFTITSYVYKAGESIIKIRFKVNNDTNIYFRTVDEANNVSEPYLLTLSSSSSNDEETEGNISNGNSNDNNDNKDNSVSNKILPFAGGSKFLIIVIIALCIAIIFLIKKNKEFKDVK